MTTLLVILGIIVGIFLTSFLIHLTKLKGRRVEFKDWQVGDLIILKSDSSEYNQVRNSGKKMARVLGWTEYHLYLEIEDIAHQCSWDCFSDNKSAIWRRNFNNCKEVMGIEPGFKPSISDTSSSSLSGKKFDGKPIELLTEVECEVYLKKAIEDEDYNAAELIRKRMEKFR